MLPALAAGLLRSVGTRALAFGGEQLAKTGIFTKAAPKLGQTNLGAKDLFKQAFSSSGMASPEDIKRQQQKSLDSTVNSKAAEEATAALKQFGKTATAVGGSISAMPALMTGFGKALLSSQEYLRAYSTEIQHAWAVLEGRRLHRDVRHAGATEDTTTMLAESLNSLEETLAPYIAAIANGLNLFGTAGVSTIDKAIQTIEILHPPTKMLADYMRRLADDKTANNTAQLFTILEGMKKRGDEAAKSRFARDVPKEEEKK